MSMREIGIRYKIEIEGAEESIAELEDVLSSTARGIHIVTSLDYTFMALQRTVEDFNVMNFTRSILSVISLMQTLISVIRTAQAAQESLNIALAIGQALGGPAGWATLAAAVPIGVGVGYTFARITDEQARAREQELRMRYRTMAP